MSKFPLSTFEQKLGELDCSQNSIQTLSVWIIHHKSYAKELVQEWFRIFKKGHSRKRLNLFYLANDVVQNARKKATKELKDEFAACFMACMPLMNDSSIKGSVLRVLQIWKERRVFEADYLSELQGSLDDIVTSAAPSMPDPPMTEVHREPPSNFKLNSVLKTLRNMADLESQVVKKKLDMEASKVDASSLQSVKMVKDRSSINQFCKDFEESRQRLDEYCTVLANVVSEQRVLLERLHDSELYFQNAFEESKVIVNAYKTFGQRLVIIKKKLEDKANHLQQELPSSVVGEQQQQQHQAVKSQFLQSPSVNTLVHSSAHSIPGAGPPQSEDPRRGFMLRPIPGMPMPALVEARDCVEVADMEIESDDGSKHGSPEPVFSPSSPVESTQEGDVAYNPEDPPFSRSSPPRSERNLGDGNPRLSGSPVQQVHSNLPQTFGSVQEAVGPPNPGVMHLGLPPGAYNAGLQWLQEHPLGHNTSGVTPGSPATLPRAFPPWGTSEGPPRWGTEIGPHEAQIPREFDQTHRTSHPHVPLSMSSNQQPLLRQHARFMEPLGSRDEPRPPARFMEPLGSGDEPRPPARFMEPLRAGDELYPSSRPRGTGGPDSFFGAPPFRPPLLLVPGPEPTFGRGTDYHHGLEKPGWPQDNRHRPCFPLQQHGEHQTVLTMEPELRPLPPRFQGPRVNPPVQREFAQFPPRLFPSFDNRSWRITDPVEPILPGFRVEAFGDQRPPYGLNAERPSHNHWASEARPLPPPPFRPSDHPPGPLFISRNSPPDSGIPRSPFSSLPERDFLGKSAINRFELPPGQPLNILQDSNPPAVEDSRLSWRTSAPVPDHPIDHAGALHDDSVRPLLLSEGRRDVDVSSVYSSQHDPVNSSALGSAVPAVDCPSGEHPHGGLVQSDDRHPFFAQRAHFPFPGISFASNQFGTDSSSQPTSKLDVSAGTTPLAPPLHQGPSPPSPVESTRLSRDASNILELELYGQYKKSGGDDKDPCPATPPVRTVSIAVQHQQGGGQDKIELVLPDLWDDDSSDSGSAAPAVSHNQCPDIDSGEPKEEDPWEDNGVSSSNCIAGTEGDAGERPPAQVLLTQLLGCGNPPALQSSSLEHSGRPHLNPLSFLTSLFPKSSSIAGGSTGTTISVAKLSSVESAESSPVSSSLAADELRNEAVASPGGRAVTSRSRERSVTPEMDSDLPSSSISTGLQFTNHSWLPALLQKPGADRYLEDRGGPLDRPHDSACERSDPVLPFLGPASPPRPAQVSKSKALPSPAYSQSANVRSNTGQSASVNTHSDPLVWASSSLVDPGNPGPRNVPLDPHYRTPSDRGLSTREPPPPPPGSRGAPFNPSGSGFPDAGHGCMPGFPMLPFTAISPATQYPIGQSPGVPFCHDFPQRSPAGTHRGSDAGPPQRPFSGAAPRP